MSNPVPVDPILTNQHKPWDTHGRIIAGDFVAVINGNNMGRQGFVEEITATSDLLIEETVYRPMEPAELEEPKEEGDKEADEKEQAVSRFVLLTAIYLIFNQTFTAPSWSVYCYDRIKQYDFVEVVHGPMKGRSGYVVAIQRSGYLWIQGAFDGPVIESGTKIVSTRCFPQIFTATYSILLIALPAHQLP
jgi:ribosomal protein L24